VSRITYADGAPNQQRHSLRRAIAEVLRRMSTKPDLDSEAKDMAAFIVFALREIAASVDKSASAWEKRDYYLKADAFRRDWAWVEPAADRLHAAMRRAMGRPASCTGATRPPVRRCARDSAHSPGHALARLLQATRPTSLTTPISPVAVGGNPKR
jgi:hypothetical protein